MEPRIQYAKTSDGVSIAYAVFGDGPPIVFAGGGFGDINLYSSAVTPLTHNVDTLAGLGRRVVLYDARGTGSSDHSDTDFSLESRLLDLEAVIERAEIDRFALWGLAQGVPLVITYVVKHPDRVSRVVLMAPWARGADFYKLNPAMRATRAADAMAEEQWEYHTLALANAMTGFKDSDLANRFAAAIRAGISATAYVSNRDANEKIDVTDLLPLVNVPAVVVGLPSGAFVLSSAKLERALASRIPNARLESPADVPAAIDSFLREGEEAAASQPPARPERVEGPSGTAIILFADIVDSTALTEHIGDAAFRDKACELNASLRNIIRESGGAPIEGPTLGDGVLAVFTAARQAIEAALRCATAGNREGLPLHVGIHAGDVIRENDPDGRGNVYGGAVNIASRISGLSAPGEVLVSDTVRSLARTSAGVAFDDRGEQALKGVGEAVRVWVVTEGDA